jgi:hypothetical protein
MESIDSVRPSPGEPRSERPDFQTAPTTKEHFQWCSSAGLNAAERSHPASAGSPLDWTSDFVIYLTDLHFRVITRPAEVRTGIVVAPAFSAVAETTTPFFTRQSRGRRTLTRIDSDHAAAQALARWAR